MGLTQELESIIESNANYNETPKSPQTQALFGEKGRQMGPNFLQIKGTPSGIQMGPQRAPPPDGPLDLGYAQHSWTYDMPNLWALNGPGSNLWAPNWPEPNL